jgi:hypothetical protein
VTGVPAEPSALNGVYAWTTWFTPPSLYVPFPVMPS